MSWIKEISFEDARGQLKQLYKRIAGPDGYLDNVLSVHSLRPHTLLGHMTLYKNVLHHKGNTLPKWYLEAVGVYVSMLNKCEYCVDHHAVGLKRLLAKKSDFANLIQSLRERKPSLYFDKKFTIGLDYAFTLTIQASNITQNDIGRLREAGFTDGEILELNQLVSYFNYVNRTVVGLGVNTEGDILGLSPNDSEHSDNWSHS